MHPVEALLVPIGRAFRGRRADPAASLASTPELATGTAVDLTSTAFRDGDVIPAKHCGPLIGQNVSPALSWSALPAGTVDLVLLLEDLDSPGATPRIHTIAAFSPTADGLPEGALTADAPRVRFLPRGGKPGRYVGPRPMPGHGPHRYRFHLCALDAPLDVAALMGPEQLASALAGHVLGSGSLTGTRTS